MAVTTDTPPADTLTREATHYLSVVSFAKRVGAHPNTVRRMLSRGDIPHLLLDLDTEEILPQDSARPRRFQYLLEPQAVQHVAHQLNPPGSPPGKQDPSAPQQATLVASPESISELWEVRAENRQLRAENQILREYNDRLNTITDRLLPLLPKGAIEGDHQGTKQSFWQRLWPRNRGREQNGKQLA